MAAHPMEETSHGVATWRASTVRSRAGIRALRRASRTPPATDETRRLRGALARRILAEVPGTISPPNEDRGILRFALEPSTSDWKLRTVFFSIPCLDRLRDDSDVEIKLEYLRRDIERAARTRRVYVYPHSLWALLDE